MEQQLSLHLKKFNEKIKAMNQTNAKELVLTPTDARNIHSDLFALLTKINDLTNIQKEDNQAVNVDFDGGDF
jgi:hypothetical protein|tara:strand:- start:124 stop:339 length:216 start_codon:yes stop_codon:yes gene_type:complete